MFNIVISLYRVSLPRQQRPLQTCKTATATHSALKRTYRTLYSQNRKMHSPNISPHSMRKVSCVCHFFHTSTNATSLTLRQTPPLFLIRSAAISLSLNTRRCYAISLSLNTRRCCAIGFANTLRSAGLSLAGDTPHYAAISLSLNTRRCCAIGFANTLRSAGLSLAGDTPSWRGYVLAAGGGLRAYAAHCPRSIAPFTTSPKKRRNPPNGRGSRIKKRRNPHNARGSKIKKRRNPPNGRGFSKKHYLIVAAEYFFATSLASSKT